MASDAEIKLSASLDVQQSTTRITAQINQIESQIDPIKIKIDSTQFKQATEQIKNSIQKIGELSKRSFKIDTESFNIALQAFNQANSYLNSLKTKQAGLKKDSSEYAKTQQLINSALADRTRYLTQLKDLAVTDNQLAKVKLAQNNVVNKNILLQVDALKRASAEQEKAVRNQMKLKEQAKETAVNVEKFANKISLLSAKYGDIVVDGKKVSESTKELTNALKSVTTPEQLKNIINQFDILNGKIRVVNENTKLIDFRRLQNQTLDEIEQDFQDIINKTPALQAEITRLRTSLNAIGSTNAIPTLTRDINTFRSRVQQSVPNLNNFKQQLLSIAGGLGIWTSATQALRGFIMMMRNGINIAREYDAILTDVAITTGFTAEQTKELTQLIFQQSQALGANAKVTAEIAKTYANATSSIEDLGTQMEAASILANVAGLSAKQAVDTIQGISQQFQIDDTAPENLIAIDDALVSISSSLKFDFSGGIQSISAAIQKGGAVAKDAGFTFEEFAASIGTVVEKTRLSGETVGTAFRTIAARLGRVKDEVEGTTENVSKAEEAFRSVGIELRDSTNQFRDLPDVLGELSSKWDSLSQTQKNYVSEQAAGVRQISIFKTLMDNYSQTVELATQAENSQGAALLANQAKYESLEGYLNRLSSAWQELWANTVNSTFFKALIQLLTDVLEGINAINEAIGGNLIPTLAILTASLVTLKSIGIIVGLQQTATAATATASAFNGLALSSGGVVTGVKAISTALATSGWGAIVLAIGAVVGGIYALNKAIEKNEKELSNQRIELLKDEKALKDKNKNVKELLDLYQDENTSLARRIEIAKELNELDSKYILVLDEKGNAILDITQANDTYNESLEEQKEVQEDLFENAKNIYEKDRSPYLKLKADVEAYYKVIEEAKEIGLTPSEVIDVETLRYLEEELVDIAKGQTKAFDTIVKISERAREVFGAEIRAIREDLSLEFEDSLALQESFDLILSEIDTIISTGARGANSELDTLVEKLNELGYIGIDTSEIIYKAMIDSTYAVSKNAQEQAESVEAAFAKIEESAEDLANNLNENISNVKSLEELLELDKFTSEDLLKLYDIDESFSQYFGESEEVIKEAIRNYIENLDAATREGISLLEALNNESFKILLEGWDASTEGLETVGEVNQAVIQGITNQYAESLLNLDETQGEYYLKYEEIAAAVEAYNQSLEELGIPRQIELGDVRAEIEKVNELNRALSDVGIKVSDLETLQPEQIFDQATINLAYEYGRELTNQNTTIERQEQIISNMNKKLSDLKPIFQTLGREDLIKQADLTDANNLKVIIDKIKVIYGDIAKTELFPKKPTSKFQPIDIDAFKKNFKAVETEKKNVQKAFADLEKDVNNLAKTSEIAAKTVNTNVNSEYADMFVNLNTKYGSDNENFKTSQDKNITTARNTASSINVELNKIKDVNVKISYSQVNKPIGVKTSTTQKIPITNTNIPYKFFANGGIIDEPTLAFVGEKPSSNPEAIVNNKQIQGIAKLGADSAIQDLEKTRELYRRDTTKKATSDITKSISSTSQASSKFAEIEFDRYKKLNEELEIYEDRLKKIKELKDSRTNEENLKLLQEEISLYQKQRNVVGKLAAEQRKELGEVKAQLRDFGFNIVNGEIENYTKLQEMVNQANRTGSETTKEQVENAERLIDEYYNLKNAIRDLETQWLSYDNTINSLNFDALIYSTELVNENLTEQFELLDYSLKLLEDNDYLQKVDLLIEKQRLKIVQRAQLQSALANIEKQLREGILLATNENIGKLKELEEEIRNLDIDIKELGDTVDKELEGIFNNILKDIEGGITDQREVIKDILDDINDAYKERKEILDDELKSYKEAVNYQLEILKNKKEERDFDKETQELYKERQEILEQLDRLSLDTSFTAKKERDKLQKELAELDDKITERAENQRLKEIEDSLKNEIELKEKANEEELANMEFTVEYNNEMLTMRYDDMVKFLQNESNLLNEYYENLTGRFGLFSQIREQLAQNEYTNLTSLFMDLESGIGEISNNIGNDITMNIINKIKEMQNLLSTAIGFKQSESVTEIIDVVNEMKANADAWRRTSDEARRQELANRNLELGASIGANRDQAGVWWLNGERLFNLASATGNQQDIVNVVETMRRNSEEWWNADPLSRTNLANINQELASDLGATRDEAGVWWLGGQRLYDLADEISSKINDYNSLFSTSGLTDNISNMSYGNTNNLTMTNNFTLNATNGSLDRTELQQAADYIFNQFKLNVQNV